MISSIVYVRSFVVIILTCRHRNTNMNLRNITSTTSDSFETFSKLMECQYDKKNEDKDVVVKNFVDESLFFKKIKNTTKSADNYVQKLNNEVLPRCQSAEITSNIVQSDVNIPMRNTQFQSSFNEQLDTNINTDGNNKKSKNMSQREHVHFVDSSKNVCKTNNSQQLSDFSKSHESVKYCKNNIGTIYIKAQVSDEKKKDDCKLHHLTVNQSYRVNVKPELSTKKLNNIQIKPDDKETLRNPESNVTYREFSFGLEPETCKCQPATSNLQPGINDKKVALCEIRNILYGMMYEESANNPSNDYLISQLQKIMTTLREIETLEINGSSILKDLVEEHSIIGLCETVIKKKLMAITETFNDDNMSTYIENSTNQAIKQVPTIKNVIHPINQLMKFPDFLEDKFVGKVKCAYENFSNCHPNNTSHSKNFHNNTSKKNISVREFLCQKSNNFASSKTNRTYE